MLDTSVALGERDRECIPVRDFFRNVVIFCHLRLRCWQYAAYDCCRPRNGGYGSTTAFCNQQPRAVEAAVFDVARPASPRLAVRRCKGRVALSNGLARS